MQEAYDAIYSTPPHHSLVVYLNTCTCTYYILYRHAVECFFLLYCLCFRLINWMFMSSLKGTTNAYKICSLKFNRVYTTIRCGLYNDAMDFHHLVRACIREREFIVGTCEMWLSHMMRITSDCDYIILSFSQDPRPVLRIKSPHFSR